MDKFYITGIGKLRWLSDLSGQTFGRLLVLAETDRFVNDRGKSLRRWLCRCACGKEVVVRQANLRQRLGTRSCGCGKLDMLRNRKIHGLSRSPLYHVWRGMLGRCANHNHSEYGRYGGRGVTVCPTWKASFVAFRRDMGDPPFPRAQLDRIDNDGPYCPYNVRWATPSQQARNRRSNRILTYGGVEKTLVEWSEDRNIKLKTLWNRLKRGWPVDRVLEFK